MPSKRGNFVEFRAGLVSLKMSLYFDLSNLKYVDSISRSTSALSAAPALSSSGRSLQRWTRRITSGMCLCLPNMQQQCFTSLVLCFRVKFREALYKEFPESEAGLVFAIGGQVN